MLNKSINMVPSMIDVEPNTHLDLSPRSLSSESIKPSSIFISATTLTDSSSESSLASYSNIQVELNEYLNIGKIKNDFDTITLNFEESIYQALNISDNCMLPCFNVVCDKQLLSQPTGSFAVIDIGGSTLRVSVVKFLDGNNAHCIVNKSWTIEDSNKHLDRSFFKWIAFNFASLINDDLRNELKNNDGNIKVGITWSFPIIQNESSNRGIVSDLGKGFSISDEFKGKDLKDIFENCFQNNGISIKIYSIVNDSISVFVTGAYFNNAKIGLVQGTGVNSCFLIDQSTLGEKKRGILKNTKDDKQLLINSEASFLGSHLHDYICNADKKMNQNWNLMGDEDIIPPHLTTDKYGVFQPLEVLTSGRYIPEIVRRIMVERLCKNSLISIDETKSMYSLSAEFLASLYQRHDRTEFKEELEELLSIGNLNLKSEDLNMLKIITETVILRASLILSSYIIALVRVMKFTKLPELEISVIGSMLQFFPNYKETVLDILETESKKGDFPQISFDFIKDSSIYGASIAAFVNQERMGL
ncbi:hypothetical protein C6P40_002573 [Pichia californica]|uniref:Phosphotransferase n=1 Tax=Pichia californica TaxID=460514 RepID=A0A9P7BF39_9ASCO|nr:hypothetical protein C6P40_002573 [[Candida] californica]